MIGVLLSVETKDTHQHDINVEMVKNQRSVRGISSSQLQDEMYAAALV